LIADRRQIAMDHGERPAVGPAAAIASDPDEDWLEGDTSVVSLTSKSSRMYPPLGRDFKRVLRVLMASGRPHSRRACPAVRDCSPEGRRHRGLAGDGRYGAWKQTGKAYAQSCGLGAVCVRIEECHALPLAMGAPPGGVCTLLTGFRRHFQMESRVAGPVLRFGMGAAGNVSEQSV
jgi:hypothetical protein